MGRQGRLFLPGKYAYKLYILQIVGRVSRYHLLDATSFGHHPWHHLGYSLPQRNGCDCTVSESIASIKSSLFEYRLVSCYRFGIINCGIVYVYCINFQQIDEEDYGGIWELMKEGFMTSFAGFLVAWIIFYTGLHFETLKDLN